MIVSKINPDFTLDIPDRFRDLFEAGQEVSISADAQGRLIIVPLEQIQARLQETFGMWAGRTDLPDGGVEYMDEVRQGHRLSEVRTQFDETD